MDLDVIDLNDPESVTLFANVVSTAGENLGLLGQRLEATWRKRDSLRGAPEESEIDQVSAKVREAEAALAARQQAHDAARLMLESASQVAEATSRLAAAAIPLLTAMCPVCQQQIDPDSVAEHLRDRAVGSEELLALREALDESDRSVATARQDLEVMRAALADVRQRRQAWAQVEEEKLAIVKEWQHLRERMTYIRFVEQGLPDLSSLAQTGGFLHQLRGRLRDLAEVLDRSDDLVAIERSAAEVGSLEESLESRESRLREAAARAARLKRLSEATIEARVQVTEDWFRAIQPLVADVYSRLDPHPAFKGFEFELDTYYRRGTTTPVVRDVVENVTADPLVVFSASQANIAALSYFLAMGWTSREGGLPFVLLDDPLQSMDDVNVLGFADVCRHLRARRQLVISTHERRFAGLLERKLAPREAGARTIVLEFMAWDRSGHSIRSRTVEPDLREPVRLVRRAG